MAEVEKPWKRGDKKRAQEADHAGERKRKKLQDESKTEGDGGKKRLDSATVGYYRRVGEKLQEDFEHAEDRDVFLKNVLSEVKGEASVVAMNSTGSITLQRLFEQSSPDQVAEVMAELAGESGSDFKGVCCDRCGGHVVEGALRKVASLAAKDEEEREDALVVQVLSLSRVVRDNSAEFLQHVYGSHVVRTLLHVLAGCLGPPHIPSRPAAKDRHVSPQLIDFEIPTSFWYELKSLTEALMGNVKLSVTNLQSSAVFQTMLTVCHRKRPKLCKRLIKDIMEYLKSCPAAPGVSPLLVFLKDQTSSRLVETIIQLSSKSPLQDLYKHHLKGQLVELALHPIANFPVQRLTAASAKLKLFPKLFDELVQGVEAILAAGHMGVIVQLAESCAEAEERQAELMQCLLTAFHCAEPGSRHVRCLPLFMSLLTYDVYYHSDTAEGGVQTEVPLSSICYHGSRLVQALAKFQERSILFDSLRTLTPADLLTLASNSFGSHVLQALSTTCSDKARGKILKRLEVKVQLPEELPLCASDPTVHFWRQLGHFGQMACSKVGSRVLEAIWSSASVSHRQNIADELVSNEHQLRSDQFARHVWAKFALSHFCNRMRNWMEIQTGQLNKRTLFSDILD